MYPLCGSIKTFLLLFHPDFRNCLSRVSSVSVLVCVPTGIMDVHMQGLDMHCCPQCTETSPISCNSDMTKPLMFNTEVEPAVAAQFPPHPTPLPHPIPSTTHYPPPMDPMYVELLYYRLVISSFPANTPDIVSMI